MSATGFLLNQPGPTTVNCPGDCIVDRNLIVQNDAVVDRNLTVTNDAEIDGTLWVKKGLLVDDGAIIDGGLNVNGGMDVSGNAFFNNGIDVAGGAIITGGASINGSVDLSGGNITIEAPIGTPNYITVKNMIPTFEGCITGFTKGGLVQLGGSDPAFASTTVNIATEGATWDLSGTDITLSSGTIFKGTLEAETVQVDNVFSMYQNTDEQGAPVDNPNSRFVSYAGPILAITDPAPAIGFVCIFPAITENDYFFTQATGLAEEDIGGDLRVETAFALLEAFVVSSNALTDVGTLFNYFVVRGVTPPSSLSTNSLGALRKSRYAEVAVAMPRKLDGSRETDQTILLPWFHAELTKIKNLDLS